MKRFLVCLLIVISIFYVNKNNIVIPKESIRLRVIGSSNSVYDQEMKIKVKKELEGNLAGIVGNSTNINDVRLNIVNNMDNISNIVDNTLKGSNYDKSFSINYGMNYFPVKKYNGITYKEGMYESLLVTLGEGSGNNWWCVLFPPFCLIEANDSDNIEYDFKVRELIDKYF